MSDGKTDERICDKCLKNHLVDLFSYKEREIEALEHQISEIANKRDLNTQMLRKISTIFINKQAGYIKEEEDYKQEENELKEKAKISKEKRKMLEEKILNKKKELEIVENKLENVNILTKKLEEDKIEAGPLIEELETEKRERNGILNELNEIKEFIKMRIPVRLVKRLVCSNCFPLVGQEFDNIFYPGTSGTQIKQGCETDKKNSQCTRCIVF